MVAFTDVKGASTDGADETEAIANASDCLIAALIGYITSREPIPRPSPARGRSTVTLPPLVAAKLALYSAMLEQHVTNRRARRPAWPKPKLRCGACWISIYRSDIGQIEAALAALGKRLEITVRDAA